MRILLGAGSLIDNRYEIQQRVGQGTEGVVYLTHDLNEGRQPKAVKLLTGDRFDREAERQFIRELSLLHRLANPGIVRVFEAGTCPLNGKYLTMEFIPWPTLDLILDSLSLQQILVILHDMAEILNFLHTHCLAHFDLKPKNIFIDMERLALEENPSDLVVKVGDLGMAGRRTTQEMLERRGSLIYSAPEMFAPGKVDYLADIYSLGMIAYIALTRRQPFNVSLPTHFLVQKRGWLPREEELNARGIPRSLGISIIRCLCPNPALRLSRLTEFLGELARHLPRDESGYLRLDATPFVGRTVEIRQLSNILTEVESGEQWAFLIRGDTGIGKSSLIVEFAFRKQLEGIRVLHIVGEECKLSRGWWDIEAPEVSARANVSDDFLEMILSGKLNEIFEDEPTLICWHRFDVVSSKQIRMFKEVLLRRPKLPILWLLEVCEEPPELIPLTYNDHLVHRELGDFSVNEAMEFVGQLLGFPPKHQDLARNLHAFLGGNPNWLRLGLKKLVQHRKILYENGRFNILNLNPADSFRDAGELFGVDLRGLSNTAKSLAELLAVLNQPMKVEDCWMLFELESPAWNQVLKELIELELVVIATGSIRFRLPVLREMVYSTIPSDQRAELHLWAGRYLEEKTADAPELNDLISIAYHYSLANSTPALARVVRETLQSAQRIPNAPLTAAFLKTTLELPPGALPDEIRCLCQHQLAEKHLNAGEYKDAANLWQNLLDDKRLRNYTNLPNIHLRLGQCLALTSDSRDAKTHLRTAFQLQKEINPAEAARALSPLAYLYFQEGNIEKSLLIIEDFRNLLNKIPVGERKYSLLYALGKLLVNHGLLDEATKCFTEITSKANTPWKSSLIVKSNFALIELALKCGEHERAARIIGLMEKNYPPMMEDRLFWQLYYLKGIALISRGQVRTGKAEIERIEMEIKIHARPIEQCRLLNDLILVDYFSGDYTAGIRRIRRLISLSRRCGLNRFKPLGFAWAVRFLRMKDKPVEKLVRVSEISLHGNNHPYTRVLGSFVLAEYFLESSEFGKALNHCESVVKNLNQADIDIPLILLDLMRELCRLNLPTLESQISEQVNKSSIEDWSRQVSMVNSNLIKGKCWTLLSQITLLEGHPSAAKRYLGKAASAFQKAGAPFLLARSLEQYSILCSKYNIMETSQRMLSEAVQIYRGLGLKFEKVSDVTSYPAQPYSRQLSTSHQEQPLDYGLLVGTMEENKTMEIENSLPFKNLSRVTSLLSAMTDPDEVTKELLEMAMESVGAKRGFILFRKDKTPGLSRRIAIRIAQSEQQTLSHTIADLAFRTKEPIFCDDALSDEYLGSLESVRLGVVHTVACLPILSRGEAEGVLYLDFGGAEGSLRESDRLYLRMLTDLIGVALTQSQILAGLKEDVHSLRISADRRSGYGDIVGNSPALLKVFQTLSQIRGFDVPVLILGETGTGKELISRSIHRESNRASQPFIALNCAAFPETLVESLLFGHTKGAFTGANSDHIGFFEQADSGTIFLDEIDESTWSMQGKLLRILQTGEFFRLGETKVRRADVRVIAAAKPNILGKIETRAFREDLYFRLNVVQINIPPLRERTEDIPLLVHHFVTLFSRQLNKSISAIQGDAEKALLYYDWQGNVRQLENAIRQAVMFADNGEPLSLKHLPREIAEYRGDGRSFSSQVKDFEQRLIQDALSKSGGNASEVARELKISRSTLQRKLRKYKLSGGWDKEK